MSEIRSDGRPYCVVDNRWTCKITDYGLGHFKSSQKKEEFTDFKQWTGRKGYW